MHAKVSRAEWLTVPNSDRAFFMEAIVVKPAEELKLDVSFVFEVLGSYATSEQATSVGRHIPHFGKYRSVCSEKILRLGAVLHSFVKWVLRYTDRHELRMVLGEAIVECNKKHGFVKLLSESGRSDAGLWKMKMASSPWANMY
ncbi:hypothetical protein HBI56_191950 [Parastagonospora nodorum]|uniref:Uncharacterized protein n=1 Tax=Phaeosphaeria nodorum (strain SN15 / ATCC MYA-4574 / FGSC 10173) TaxID=321614 RepID=A0A7U2NPY8_PHANO|nr:hypothetical protein HBH56_178390 [Parastagonospora nodorum]QRD06150.1 hypothetical protein JI435_445350 [Parastagonospora nodorum SN15]KAH3931829.1 hypothetical protein HBH54_091430 [Parastagonospora nodorum]KAH3939562.1 hypothetical protein HBH53_233010 [Parastagonospora nodorum]KAH3957457.1 hypothetical protein HBH51_224970 [Parastagonospora nodorum]